MQRTGGVSSYEDAYAFGPALGPLDDHLMIEGTHRELYKRLGAQITTHEGVGGVLFALWAPNASRVSVVGDFNGWDGRRCQMRKRFDSGLWEIFIPHLGAGTVYKYEIVSASGELQPLKADPFGFEARTAALDRLHRRLHLRFRMDRRRLSERRAARASCGASRCRSTKCHLGSWRRGEGGRFLSYDELADTLIPYVAELGFTHLELHAGHRASARHLLGLSADRPVRADQALRRRPRASPGFVDNAHAMGVGVILDWVPAHFPTDAHGLAWFDGAPLYEHADPRRGFHPDWNTAIYDFGRREVANFLDASALYWFDRFHVDGLRVDAVASMLYLDYSRKAGEWMPNADGGNENYDAIAFLKRANEAGLRRCSPAPSMIAEESTAFPGVTKPDQCRRPRLRLQMEHGLDARHPGLHDQGSRVPPLGARPADLRPALCVQREFRAADLP